jgi:GntR family transcriptional repressor for pyruvate dehydrogenase complex
MERKNTSDLVFEKIQEKILNKEWRPGMKISSETQLASELKVSRSSVRESIEKMVVLNILTKKQGGGTYVNRLTPATYLNDLIPLILLDKNNIVDILDFREVIETECIKFFVERYDEAIIEQLKAAYQKMKDYENDRGSTNFADADCQFHLLIGIGAKNTMLTKVITILTKVLSFYQIETFKNIGPKDSVEEHQRILDAIIARDGELGALLMKRHIQHTRKSLEQAYKNRNQVNLK